MSNGTKPKQRPRSQSREDKKPKSHYQPQYRRKQYVKTDAVYNNRTAEEQMESLTFNCINMTQRDEAFVLINIKLPNRNGIHKLRLKIDTRAQGNTLPVSTLGWMFPEKLDADGFGNIKKQFINKKLIPYNGTPIKCFGNIKISCQYNKSDWHVSTFHIVNVQAPAVLGLPSIAGTAQTNYPSLYSQERRCIPNSCSNTDKCNQRPDADVSWSVRQNWLHSRCSQTIGKKNIHPHIDAPRKPQLHLKSI